MADHFKDITRHKYHDIKRRGAPQYADKDRTRLKRPEIPMEFTLDQFRAWVAERFGTDGFQSLTCLYACGRYITLETFVPDHIRALARGGRNTLDNLGACCESCNDEKGELTGRWYAYLRKCLEQMPDDEARIILERLRKSEKAASSVRSLRAFNKKLQSQIPQNGGNTLG